MENYTCEMAGWYGPFTLAEREIQKLWLRQSFAAGPWRTLDGRELEVLHPGRWNLLEGPDFYQALFRLDGELKRGDVEIHFEVEDWWRHGHADDPRYSDVQLHVVVFPPSAAVRLAQTRCGGVPATLVLLGLLPEDLESLATEAALLGWGRADWEDRLVRLLAIPLVQRRAVLEREAASRWGSKLAQANHRLRHHGWREAMHQMTMECFGLARNREAMSRLALLYPAVKWQRGEVDPAEVMCQPGLNWRLRGVRPANQPIVRLQQYMGWWNACDDWPEQLLARLRRWGECSCADVFAVGRQRRVFGLSDLRRAVMEAHGRDGPGMGRINTWWTDVVWPLGAAALGRTFFGYWAAWFAGDYPDSLLMFVRESGVLKHARTPLGVGLLQGALGWLACEEESTQNEALRTGQSRS